MLASSEMINMEIYLIWNHTGVVHNDVESLSEDRARVKLSSWENASKAEKEIEIEKNV